MNKGGQRQGKVIPVILSGGSGTRLWPVSRALYPKQLHALISDRTMFQETVLRVAPEAGFAPPIVVCNEEHRFFIAEQLRELGREAATIVLEPAGRNTAPAVAVAALLALRGDPDAIIAVFPADHAVADLGGFHDALAAAAGLASRGHLVTFGIVPTAPETGYGYIQRGPGPVEGGPAYPVARFVEKPGPEIAQGYLDDGGYYWNSGIFVFRADRYLAEVERFCPRIGEYAALAVDGGREDLDFFRLDEQAFLECPSDSIDYAVMEHTEKAVVIPLDVGWNDVGSWSALWEIGQRDGAGNVLLGDVVAEDTKDSYIRSESRLVATLGISGLAVIETADAVLVAARDQASNLRRLVDGLKSRGREESVSHLRVYRPWGFYETLETGDRFQVKLLMIKPGARLSLQKHAKRAEHWVVVNGTARVTRGEEELTLTEDQSTYIPIGTVHRIENPGPGPLNIIEVQSGSYLGEDDIIRLEDVYGRH